MATKLIDVAKGANDLLTKSFKYDNKVEIKSKASNGVTFTSEAQVSKPSSVFVKAEGKSGTFSVDKLQVSSDKKIAAEFSLADAAPGTKLTAKFTDGSRAAGADAITAVVGAEIKSGKAFTTFDVDAIKQSVAFTTLVAYKDFLLGASAKITTDSGVKPADYGVLVGYKTKEYTVSAETEAKLAGLKATFYHVSSPTLTTAAIARMPLTGGSAYKSSDVSLGFAYAAAADTTITTRVSSAGKVAVSYAQQVSPMTKLTFATEIDAANIASDDHKVGVLLSILN